MALPPPTTEQPFCNVSALEGGTMNVPDDAFIDDAVPGEQHTIPALAFLIQHSQRTDKIVFDLGIRSDLKAYPPSVQHDIATMFKVDPESMRVIDALAKGGLTPDDIDYVCISHVHFDHTGDPQAFKKSTFLVGEATRPLFDDAYPANPDSDLPSDLLPADRTRYLSPEDWTAIGPFPRAFDFFSDGSLYIVDSPGHIPGHINVLARTSADGAWVYLASDSAHHWRIITGQSQIKTGMPYGESFCMHTDKHAAEEHIARVRALLDIPRVQVILAHGGPFYDANKGGDAFWPGKIQPL